jgi:hypothetical protein
VPVGTVKSKKIPVSMTPQGAYRAPHGLYPKHKSDLYDKYLEKVREVLDGNLILTVYIRTSDMNIDFTVVKKSLEMIHSTARHNKGQVIGFKLKLRSILLPGKFITLQVLRSEYTATLILPH